MPKVKFAFGSIMIGVLQYTVVADTITEGKMNGEMFWEFLIRI